MTAMKKALRELDDDSFHDEEGDKVLLLKFAKQTLEQFEIDFLKELEEEKLKQEYANR